MSGLNKNKILGDCYDRQVQQLALHLNMKINELYCKITALEDCCEGGGGTGEDKNFVYEQGVPSNLWIVNHNLNKRVSVSVVDTADTIIRGEITYINNNQITIRFNTANAGKAYLN